MPTRVDTALMLARMDTVLIRQHLERAPPGRLAEWLEARGLPYEVSRSWRLEPLPDPEDHAFVVSLGHDLGAADTHDPAIRAEHELLRRAVAREVPVLGLCYGGQVLAAILGATVARAPTPELGWREIDSDEPAVIPAGAWITWHYDRFQTPPRATELARTADASQAFRLGPHLGVQFHPEATVEIMEGWANSEGVDPPPPAPPERRRAARDAAFRLFDAFLNQSQKRLAA